MKKADLSINTIIAAAIGLVVFIVIVLIFTGKIKVISGSIEGTCQQQGGLCEYKQPGQNCPTTHPIRKLAQGCCDSSKNDCKKLQDIGACCLKDIG